MKLDFTLDFHHSLVCASTQASTEDLYGRQRPVGFQRVLEFFSPRNRRMCTNYLRIRYLRHFAPRRRLPRRVSCTIIWEG